MIKLFEDIFCDSIFYKNLIKVALPIIIQNFIASSLNVVDTVIVGKLGEMQIASVGIANQFMIIFNGLLLALSASGILSFFKVSNNVLHDSLIILYITSVVLIIRVFNIVLIVGILRGGGDTKFSFSS